MYKLTDGGAVRLGVGLSAPVLALLAATAPATAQNDSIQVAQATTPTTPAPTTAQKAAAAKAAAAKAQPEEIVVTGSRIRQPNLTSVSPLAVVNAAELKLAGYTNVEDLVNQLPQAFASQGSSISNGSSGTATVNLRGLGCTRTLVLIDGRRVMAGDPGGTPCVDLNNIPTIAIERVDIVTGGASATYGSDAVAGVVNFIMKKNFEGVKVDFEYNFYNHENTNSSVQALVKARNFKQAPSSVNDGHVYTAGFLIGANSENAKGNITFYGQYQNRQPLTQSERDYSACSLGDNGDGTYSCAGSGTVAGGRFIMGGRQWIPDASGNFIPYSGARDAFNFAPYNYFQRQDDRYNFGANGHYQISKAFDAYFNFNFTDDHTLAQIAPSGAFVNSGPAFSFNCANPFLSADERSKSPSCVTNPTTGVQVITLGRRLVEGGPRIDDLRHTNYKIDVGLRGDIDDSWNYDVYAQYGTSLYSENYKNDVSIDNVNKSLDVVLVNGVPTCRSVVNGSDPNCVPANIFRAGGLTAGAAKYWTIPGLKEGSTTLQVVSGSITGNLGKYGFKSPLASEGFKLSVGAEYRREATQLLPDLAFQNGTLAGQGGATPAIAGNYDVKEGFFEARMPLIENKPLIKGLSIEGGYRYSDYSISGTTDAYKAGLEYLPTEDARFRVSFNHAVRAPNIYELFNPQAFGNTSGNDPCAGARPTFSQAQCARTGVTAAQYGNVFDCSASQCSGLFGGNPLLRPEVSDTKSFGVVLTPGFVPGFNFSVDYFDIKVDDYIQAGLDQTLILTQCALTGNPFFCSLIKRDPGGSVAFLPGFISQTNLNSGSLQTQGFDLNGNYRFDLPDWIKGGAGSIAITYKATILKNLITEPIVGLGKFDCAGYFGAGGCGTPAPIYRHNARFTWESPWDLDLSMAWRYFDQTKYTGNTSDPFFGNNPSIADAKIPAVSYIDLAAVYRWKNGITLRASVNNVADKDPPIISSGNSGAGSFNNGNIYSQVYDCCGRTVYMGVTVDF